MQIFHVASRADMGLWTASNRNAYKSILFSHVWNLGYMCGISDRREALQFSLKQAS